MRRLWLNCAQFTEPKICRTTLTRDCTVTNAAATVCRASTNIDDRGSSTASNKRLRRQFCSVAQWNDEAEAVIIGGGAVGTALAYQLSKKGMKNVILLEKSELTAGSTWHAAGQVAYFNGAINMKKAHLYAVNVLNQLEEETDQQIGFHKPGSLRLAETPTRVDEMNYQLTRSQWHPASPVILNPDQIKEVHPLLNTDNILAGLYNEGDGHVDPYSLTQAYAAGARKYGAQIIQGCEVTATNAKADGRWDVTTDKGTINTKHVVNVGGLWAKEVGKLAGINIQAIPAHHQYVVTSSIPEVEALEKELPVIRDLEGSHYLRQERQGLLYGPYENSERMRLCNDWLANGPPKGFGKELFEPDLDRISEHTEKAMELVPCIQNANIQSIVSGPITYGPDGLPQVGPYIGLHNYWVSVAHTYGIVHSAGMGEYLSHWMIHGEPPFECIDTDPNRYSATWCTEEFLMAKVREAYGMNFSVAYPKEVRMAGRPTSRVTPINKLQQQKGAQFSISAGWEVADWYAQPGDEAGYKPSFRRTNWFEPVGRECKAVLERVGVIDLTSFGKIEVTGPDGEAFIDYVYANDVPQVNEVKVSHMLTSVGTIHAEHTVTRVNPSTYWCLTGGSAELHDLRWMETIARCKKFDVTLRMFSDDMMVLSIAGPKSRDVMSQLTDCDVSNSAWPFMTKKDVKLGGVPVTAMRISYTGELGWELFHRKDDMVTLYEAIHRVGEKFGISCFGKFALDSLRQEKGIRAWGQEMTTDTNALEAGVGMFVKLNKKADFLGKQALLDTKKQGLKRKLAFMTVETDDNVDPEGNETVWCDNEVVGYTTSGCYGWQIGSSICMAYLPMPLAQQGQEVEVQILGNRYKALVHKSAPVKVESRR